MEPITRKEKILTGEDIQPITRLEYFLKEAAGGGGGSALPPYSTLDDGRRLAVKTSNTGVTVVPSQYAVIPEDDPSGYGAALEDADAFSSLMDADECVLTVDDNTFTVTYDAQNSRVSVLSGLDTYTIRSDGEGVYFIAYNDGYVQTGHAFTVMLQKKVLPPSLSG